MKRFISGSVLIILALLCVSLANLIFGSVDLPLNDLTDFFTGAEVDLWKQKVFKLRFLALATALIVGAALSVSGLQMQSLFNNPVAGPYILGISAGASLGVALAIFVSDYQSVSFIDSRFTNIAGIGILGAAIAGSSMIFLIIIALSSRVKDLTVLLVTGLMIGGAISAIISIIHSFSGGDAIRTFVVWSFGSFRNNTWAGLGAMSIAIVLTLILSLFLGKRMNQLALGEEYAKSLGLNIKSTRYLLIACSGILAGAATAFCGPVAFIGLAVPHIVRTVYATADHRILIPACMICGALVAATGNLISILPGWEITLPLNAVTSLFGAPLVIYILARK